MTAESGISISVGLDTSPFQKDLAAFRTMSEKAGKQVAQALENSVSPTKITKGFNDLARSINTAAAAGKNLGASINVSGLDSLAKQAGVSASGLDKMYESMVKNAQNRAFTDSLRNIQKLTGASADEMNRLAKSLGGVWSASNSFGSLKIRPTSAIAEDMRNVVQSYRDIKSSSTTSAADLQRANDAMRASLKRLSEEAKGVKKVISPDSSGSFFGGLSTGAVAAALSIGGVITTFKSLTDSMLTMSRLTTSYQSIYGSQYGATQQLDQIYNQTQAVGLQFQQTAQAAKTFFAAAQGSTLAGEANNIFNAVAKGAAALQMSTDDVNGTFLALGQMISKGKVQAEELRGQLGERLPGAFQLAAKAMNMSTAELDKFMADGKLTAEDLLPKLAQALEEKYAAAAEKAAKSLQGSINKMSTEWERFKAGVIDGGPAIFSIQVVTTFLKKYNDDNEEDKKNLDIDRKLSQKGVKPEGGLMQRILSGNTLYGAYSEAQREVQRIEDRQADMVERWYEGIEKEQELTLDKSRKTISEFLKNTKEQKLAALQADYDASIKASKEQEKVYKAQGVSIDGVLKDRVQVEQEYQRKKKEIEEKGAGGKGLANKQFKFDTGLEQLRQEVANMEATTNPASLGIEKLRNKLELEKQNALAAAEAHAKLSVQRKEATPAEAEEKKSLEVRKAELTYTQKLAEAEEKGRQTRVEFYKDFAELSGNYTESLQAQAEAIAKQGEEYRNAGIPEQLERQWEALKKLQTARDPMSGTVRGLRKYANEATDLAKGMEDVWGNAFKGMEDAIVTFAQTGKMSFTDMANSIIADLIRIAVRSSITGPLASGLGSLFSGWGSSIQTTGASSSWASFGVTPGASMALAKGGAVGGGSISDYSNSVVTRPTFFSYGVRAFARGGAGLMGEAGDEGIFPLTRNSRGDLAVSATGLADIFKAATSGYGSSNQQNSQPQVYLNINNSTGEQVSQQVKTDNNGNIRADIWVGNTAAKQMAKPGTAANQTLRSGLGIKQRAIGR